MKNRLFFGGIHPKYKKEMSTQVTTFQSITPKVVVIPLQQHIGAPCTPLVQVGDTVLKGQKIDDGEGLCVPVHASVSGKVRILESILKHRLQRRLEFILNIDVELRKSSTWN